MLYIFDWDGTISDSADKIVACMQYAAQQVGLPVLSSASIKNIIGLGLPEAVKVLYPDADTSLNEACREAYSQRFKQQDTTPSAFFPGVMSTLQTLKDDGATLAVATGKSRRGLNRVLENLGMQDYFDHTRCADETASKPHPQMLAELLSDTQVGVDKAVMIGDTEWDMTMADNIGMRKVAVSFGAHSIERLTQCKPDMLIHRFDELLDWRF